MSTARRSLPIVYLFVVAILLWLVLYPNLYLLVQSFLEGGRFTLAHYREFIGSSSQIEALGNSIWISAFSVLLSAAIGVPLAFLLTRYDFPGRRIFAALASLPVLLPPLVGVIAFLFLYGESGILNRSLQRWLGRPEPLFALRGAGAILLVHAYTMYVYFYLFVSAGLKRIDGSLAEAARSLGASRWRTFWTVTLRQLTPSLAGASLLTFMTSMASFSAPYIFGGGFRVLALQIYNSKLNGDLKMSMVETVLLTATSVAFLVILQRYEGTGRFRTVNKGAAWMNSRVTHRGARIAAAVFGTAMVTILLLPHLTLVLISFAEEGTWTTQILPPAYTIDNYFRIFSSPELLEPIFNSLQMASLATFANFVFAMFAAYLIVLKSGRGRFWLSSLVILPWALPGTVLALSLATTFSQNRLWEARILLVGTYWILPLAYFIRNIPVVVRAFQMSFEQLDPSLEDAARLLGARWFFRVTRIILPLILPGAVAGSLLAFVAALGEFVSSIVIYTLDNRPISIEILSQLRQFNFGTAAAYGVLLTFLIGVAFLLSGKYFGEADGRAPVG